MIFCIVHSFVVWCMGHLSFQKSEKNDTNKFSQLKDFNFSHGRGRIAKFHSTTEQKSMECETFSCAFVRLEDFVIEWKIILIFHVAISTFS